VASPTELSQAEIDSYSIRHHIKLLLAAEGWTTARVFDLSDGWPEYQDLYTPGVYVLVEASDAAWVPFELGSHAKRRQAFAHIFGENDAQRVRLAETISEMFRDIVPIYDYVTGNEEDEDLTASDYLETDSVAWRKLITTRNTPDKEKFRSVVTATLRRVAA
jgi:hypothetical protein